VPAQKKPVEKEDIATEYTIIPYFAVESNLPAVRGIKGIGRTPLEALIHIRGEIRKRYPLARFNLEETITNPEFVAGWRMPEHE